MENVLDNGTEADIKALKNKYPQAERIKSLEGRVGKCHTSIAEYKQKFETATGVEKTNIQTQIKRYETYLHNLTLKDLELKNRFGKEKYEKFKQFPQFAYCQAGFRMRQQRVQDGIHMNANILTE